MNCYHGELDEALANGARALAIAERIGDASLRSLTVNDLIQAHYNRGEYERVVELATAKSRSDAQGGFISLRQQPRTYLGPMLPDQEPRRTRPIRRGGPPR